MFLGSLILTKNHFPFFVAGARFFMSGCILLTLYYLRHKKTIWTDAPKLVQKSFFKYAFCLYTISAIGFAWGMQYVDPVKACFVFVLAPFITALLLFFLKQERLSLQKVYGLVIGFLAVIPIILESSHGRFVDVSLYDAVLGYLIFGLAVVFFAYGWILNQEMHQHIHVPSSLITGAALVVGGATTLVINFLLCWYQKYQFQVTDDFWWLLLLFAILTAVAYNLYSLLLKEYSATFLAFASFLEPAFGLLYAWLFFGQTVSFFSIISLLGLGFGLYLFYQEELRIS